MVKVFLIIKLERCIIKIFIISVPSNCIGDSIPDPEKFGYYNGYFKIERGWLTDEKVIQFKIFNNPIKLWKNKLQSRKVQIKVSRFLFKFIFKYLKFLYLINYYLF